VWVQDCSHALCKLKEAAGKRLIEVSIAMLLTEIDKSLHMRGAGICDHTVDAK
jgi:hypothetical protein